MPRSLKIHNEALSEYLEIIKLKGLTNRHINEVIRYLTGYLHYTNYRIDKTKSLQYFAYLKDNYSISTYRKETYQILKFLRYLKIGWTDEIKLPPDPIYYPKYISKDMIESTINYFRNHEYYLRFKALIYLGIDSGLRAEELYQLTPEDIDIKNQLVRVKHDPINGQSTKTKLSRVSFFTNSTKHILSEYLYYLDTNSNLSKLFPQRWVERKFSKAPIRVKHLRKFFSQEWDRRGGPTSIKKILMGHSLKGDVDLMHYNYQSEEDLKQIYDKVMNSNLHGKSEQFLSVGRPK
jgi:integrase/recombinase XerD